MLLYFIVLFLKEIVTYIFFLKVDAHDIPNTFLTISNVDLLVDTKRLRAKNREIFS